MKDIFKSLLAANKTKDVTNILEELIDNDEPLKWIPVGKRKNNISTINIGTDPAAGVTERITNAIDAVLEKEWLIKNKPSDIISPRIATQEWFDIEDGKLNKIKNGRDKRLQELGDKVKVTLKESDIDHHPTVEVRDYGVGLKTEQFEKTILSLNESNKIDKLHLLGAYGQGGSTALSFNVYTIIISKPYFREKGEKEEVAWTIVRINEGDVNTDKQPWYEYLINSSTGSPFTLEMNEKDFAAGTLVRHIHMDIGKYKSAMTNLTGSLWYLSHHFLFNPVMPFTISDERTKITKGKIENRKVTGNNRRLTFGEHTEYMNSAELTFGNGELTIYWWVLSTEGTEDPRNRITQYVLPSKPIIISFNGQKQGTLPNTIIKGDLKLPFLERYIIVEVECDNLDNESKRQLFSSTREKTRDTFVKEELRQTVIDTLRADEELIRLDRARKERYLKRDDTQAMDKLRQRLASRINVFLQSSGGSGSVRAKDTKETTNVKKQPPIPIQDPPTYLEITTPAPREIYPGKTFHVKFKTDAHPSYVYNPDTFLAVVDPHTIASFTGTAKVVDGYGIVYFKAREDVEVGAVGEITLEVRPPRERSLRDSVEVEVIKYDEDANSSGSGGKKVPNINPHWVGENDPMYKDEKWTRESVAKVEETSDSVEIFVSEANKNLSKLLERAQRQSSDAVDDIKNRYLEHVSFYAYMINKKEEIVEKDDNEADEEVGSLESEEKIIEKSLKHASETVCAMINDFFQAIIIESSSKEDE